MTKINAICLDNDDVEELEVGKTYEVEWIDMGGSKGWLITIKDNSVSNYIFDYDYNIIFPKHCFNPIATFRDERIDIILSDD